MFDDNRVYMRWLDERIKHAETRNELVGHIHQSHVIGMVLLVAAQLQTEVWAWIATFCLAVCAFLLAAWMSHDLRKRDKRVWNALKNAGLHDDD